jgi:hypothetical protein
VAALSADRIMDTSDPSTRALLRHLVATLAYRAGKVLRDAPASFATTTVGSGTTRQPVKIVAHMADLMAWANTFVQGEVRWTAGGGEDWDTEVRRFFAGLATLDRELANDSRTVGSVEQIIQGPLADALTHVGQLAMLRGMAGAPVRPENYARAEIVAGTVGVEQPAPRREFDGDASAARK